MSLAIIASRALLPGDPQPQPATVLVTNGKIASVANGLVDVPKDFEVLRIAEDRVLLPGLVDCHVHLNQPGRTAWEGFQTGTAAARSGGVTTLIDMPLNSIPPTTTVRHLEEKRSEALRVGLSCDVGFWGGIIPGNAGDLVPLLEAGVKGFKCFLIESGVEEFPHVGEADLREACNALVGTNALILFHAELEGHVHAQETDPKEYATFLSSRPQSLELSALDLILGFAKTYPQLRFHIVHLSAASALPVIRQARADGMKNLTVETCFHYLCLRAEDIPSLATQYKCCPPIRDEANRRLLLDAVRDGTIDFVVSDHSPCVPELKKGDFMTAWGGVSGLGLGLSLLWTELGEPLGKIVDLLGSRQAKQVGLHQKGDIKTGSDADFAIFDPDVEWTVTEADLHFKNKISPYIGQKLRGKIEQTYLRGSLVSVGQLL